MIKVIIESIKVHIYIHFGAINSLMV